LKTKEEKSNDHATMSFQPGLREAGSLQNQTFHFETLRNVGYIASECADLGEILGT
jgi:hypothetical protein